ncbi:hypothetical protein SEUCBS139899_006131 [Sporothrix eucalyptigena]|uniref:Cytochrome P450 n=1 Tax=Sporothrix eucalyptigena TaxID=1812306 RepID=A0ABP0CBW1_9PEZI
MAAINLTTDLSSHKTLLAFSVLVYWFGLAIYRLFFHPLSKYPGPLLGKLTSLYMTGTTALGHNTYTRYALHQKYGNVVRTGPNELCFADQESIKAIYGQTSEPCRKAPCFYKGFTMTGTESVFSTTDRDLHVRMRRLLSHGFSQKGVLQFEADIARMVERYLDVVGTKANAARSRVDLYDVTHHLFLDITSHLAFAQSFNALGGKPHQAAADIDTYFTICPLFGQLPAARYLPFGPFRAARQAQPRIVRAVQANIDVFRQQLREGTANSGLLRHMVEAKDTEAGDAHLSDFEMIENSVIFIIAGSGTSATTVLYLLYEMAKRPEMQHRLESEIRQAFPDPAIFPDYDTANKLPVLNCVLQETLRLRGPLQSVAPRVSPGKVIGSTFVPAGVIVSNLQYATHRDPTVFTDPLEFQPERWETATPEMKTMTRPFSIGPRNCIGMHLARVQMLLTVCALYQRFELTLDPQTTDDMMDMRDLGLMAPVGKQLWMRVVPRST